MCIRDSCGAASLVFRASEDLNNKSMYVANINGASGEVRLFKMCIRDRNYISAKDKHVVVVGGGDTGNDCVATAIRHGCISVTQLEMMPQLPSTRTKEEPDVYKRQMILLPLIVLEVLVNHLEHFYLKELR